MPLYESEFKWKHIRDAGLSIKAWLDVNDNNHDAVAEVLNAYVGWVQKVENNRVALYLCLKTCSLHFTFTCLKSKVQADEA